MEYLAKSAIDAVKRKGWELPDVLCSFWQFIVQRNPVTSDKLLNLHAKDLNPVIAAICGEAQTPQSQSFKHSIDPEAFNNFWGEGNQAEGSLPSWLLD